MSWRDCSSCVYIHDQILSVYTYIGQLMAMSIIQGGPAPTFLAPSIAQYLATGATGMKPSVEELPDENQRNIWRQV